MKIYLKPNLSLSKVVHSYTKNRGIVDWLVLCLASTITKTFYKNTSAFASGIKADS